jgi:hypothetical protein
MKRLYFKVFVVSLALFALAGCAAQKKPDPFKPYDLNPKLKERKLVPKVDNFIVVLDASGSMSGEYKGQKKVDIAKNVAHRISETIPDMKLNGALRVIGQSYGPFSKQSKLIYGLTDYAQKDFNQSLQTVTFASGGTPLGASIDAPAGSAVSQDLKSARGNIAAIVISDGIEKDNSAIEAAKNVKKEFGDRLCIYPILVGNSPQGKKLMEQIAKIGECGFTADADSIYSSKSMAGYVEKVFLAKVKGKRMLDQDQDGVPDNLDRCPGTPMGLKVDSTGCPLDSDRDGVYDHLDRCPDTPVGVGVDNIGCPLDTDRDGVYDYIDRCPKTPIGVKVDSIGCPLDIDSDGVYDYLDRCPNTPPGIKVDSVGCPLDSDRDGVYDYLDQCPGTPAGTPVDRSGCPLDRDADGVYDSRDQCPNTPRGATVNRRGCWELIGLNFDTNKWNIKPVFYPLLDRVVEIMRKNPSLKIEVQGHTDSQGAAKYNQKLSEKRAKEVKNYLIKAGINKGRIMAVGYGLKKPIASNKTAEGRERNRRVELKPVW